VCERRLCAQNGLYKVQRTGPNPPHGGVVCVALKKVQAVTVLKRRATVAKANALKDFK
jgi:hypothetical protein